MGIYPKNSEMKHLGFDNLPLKCKSTISWTTIKIVDSLKLDTTAILLGVVSMKWFKKCMFDLGGLISRLKYSYFDKIVWFLKCHMIISAA